jgi:hypothetical protein
MPRSLCPFNYARMYSTRSRTIGAIVISDKLASFGESLASGKGAKERKRLPDQHIPIDFNTALIN